jgi:hypothetical protein
MPRLTLDVAESEHRLLPSELQEDLKRFTIDGFAQQYFAQKTHKAGFFRRAVPFEQLTVWQKVRWAG